MHARSWRQGLVIGVLTTMIGASDPANASVRVGAATLGEAPSVGRFHLRVAAAADGSVALLRFGGAPRGKAFSLAYTTGDLAPGDCLGGDPIGLGGARVGYVTDLVPGGLYAFRVCQDEGHGDADVIADDEDPLGPAYGLESVTMPRGAAAVVATRPGSVVLAPPSAPGAIVPDNWAVVFREGAIAPEDCADPSAVLFDGARTALPIDGLAPQGVYAFRLCGVFAEPVHTPVGDLVTNVTSAGVTVTAKTPAR
jgi:hypothetical protein